MYTQDDKDLVTVLLSSASLDRSPNKNWVENTGNLPAYIRKIARAIEKSGKPLSTAIPMAISRVKRWAGGGDNVNADTKAKAAKAVAQWEALKAKNKAKKIVKASNGDSEFLVMLSGSPHLVSDIADRWEMLQTQVRRSLPHDEYQFTTVVEVWTTYLIIRAYDNHETGTPGSYFKIYYTRDAKGDVVFGDVEEVSMIFVPLIEETIENLELTPNEVELLGSLGEDPSSQ